MDQGCQSMVCRPKSVYPRFQAGPNVRSSTKDFSCLSLFVKLRAVDWTQHSFAIEITACEFCICYGWNIGKYSSHRLVWFVCFVSGWNPLCCVSFCFYIQFLSCLGMALLGALITTHLLCLCYQLTWLSSAINSSFKAQPSSLLSLSVCWSFVMFRCLTL